MADKPTQQAPLNPILLPALPCARNEEEFRRMSPQAKAALIAQWSAFWLNPTAAPATGQAGTTFAPIVVERQATAPDSENQNWKGPTPTREERKAMESDDWK